MMKIKLTPAQEKLINALEKDPLGDAYDHLKHIRNKQISDKLVSTMLHLGLLYKDIETGKITLPPQESMTEKKTSSKYDIPITNTSTVTEENDDQMIMTHKQVIVSENNSDTDKTTAESLTQDDTKKPLNKKEIIMEMLMRKATLNEMVMVTGWLAKSVRGVISQLKKEKNLTIIREKGENNQNYYSLKTPLSIK